MIENLNIENIESFMYLNEVRKRKIIKLDRAIWFISENMDANEFSGIIKEIKQKNISINKIWLVVSINETISIENNWFRNINLFKRLPWKLIEVYVNSDVRDNIMIPYAIDELYFKKSSKFIFLKPTDQFLSYEKNFVNPNWFNEDYFISTGVGVIFYENKSAHKVRAREYNSIKLKISKGDIFHSGVMIRVEKWSQMLIEFNENQNYYLSIEDLNKWNSLCFIEKTSSGILLDPVCVKRMYERWNDLNLYLKYPNI